MYTDFRISLGFRVSMAECTLRSAFTACDLGHVVSISVKWCSNGCLVQWKGADLMIAKHLRELG